MDFKNLPAQYDHTTAQKKWYSFWEDRGYFHADPNDTREPFTIVIPPPNVTGALHLGHALNNTLQDILIRMKRMQGYNTLWMPGTDHAGIATQAVVERRLFEEQKLTRHELGREGLVERIWKWKDQYEARILSQLKQLGCSCDWQRTRFTLDDQCARAVREWFFRLFQDGKIYRGKRLVNWDTFLQTAVSDDEVFHEAVKGHFWHFSYPVIDPKPGEPTHVTIATTRPETMLGDTAVAVHPDPATAFDSASRALHEKLASAPAKERAEIEAQIESLGVRRQAVLPQLIQLRDMALRNVQLQLPLTDRTIPLITDEWAKPELGSGAVKITPAHDANDYAVWQRHPEIGIINVMTVDGLLNDSVPEKYRGLKMHTKARDAVVADMEATGLLVETEDREIDLAHSDRSKTPIEPYLADQWFMKMSDDPDSPLPDRAGPGEGSASPATTNASPTTATGLAQLAMDAVTSGRVQITPERYAKSYLDWLSEKRDWPIGRQLWWGHRIPVWHLRATPSGTARVDIKTKVQIEEHWKQLEHWVEEGRIAVLQPAVARLSPADVMQIAEETLDKSNSEFQEKISPVLVCIRDEQDLEIKNHLEIFQFEQDSDVLDTWFSSALWPISTLGWPGETPELKKFYPTSTLITSRDIITLWVARMVISGLYNIGEVPFHEVYITPKILDGYGETMSKSKGNGVDPLDVIEKFGADALRFGLAYLTTDTQDVKLPVEWECPHCKAQFAQTKKNRQLPRIECEKCGQPFSTQWAERPEDKALPRGTVINEKFELGRNFANKLWNAARFSLINLEGDRSEDAEIRGKATNESPAPRIPHPAPFMLEDRWLLSRLTTVTQQVTELLEKYRYADAARTLYDFAWNEFCSFYLEMTKARFNVPEQRATAQQVLAHSLDILMRLLHPMMPFLTEEVWQLLGQVAPTRGLSSSPSISRGRQTADTPAAASPTESICIAPWPEPDPSLQDETIEQQFADFQAVLGAVREARQRQNVPFKEELPFIVRCDASTTGLLEPMQPYFKQMANATAIQLGPTAAATGTTIPFSLAGSHGPMEVQVDVSQFIDVAAERKRLEKERDNIAKQTSGINGKLANKAFVDKAPAEVVQQQREKLEELKNQLSSVEAALAKLPPA